MNPRRSTPIILVSSCLAGIPCRYDGASSADPAIVDAHAEGKVLARCAESAGGLPTPRPAAEIIGGSGIDVLRGHARVLTANGTDVSSEFVTGARLVADEAERLGITHAVLKARSPSCGCGSIYDGTHSGTRIEGDGVLTAELKSRGITVEVHE